MHIFFQKGPKGLSAAAEPSVQVCAEPSGPLGLAGETRGAEAPGACSHPKLGNP